MADATNAPTLLTMTRRPDGAIGFTWSNNATTSGTYTAIQVVMRKKGVTGTWTQVNQLGYPAISSQSYVQYTGLGGAFNPGVAYEMALRANGPLGWSGYSNVLDVDAMTTPEPTFTSVTRTGPDGASIVLAQNNNAPATTSATYVYGRVIGTGVWKQYNRTVDGAQTTMAVAGLDGLLEYEFYLQATGPAGLSEPSATRSVDAWWELPPAVTGLAGDRDPDGTSHLTWSGTGTAQGPWQQIRIYRATGTLGQPVLIATLPGTDTSYTDTTSAPQSAYRYQVVTVSPAGESSSKPEEALAATLLVPNTPSGGSLAYAATNQATAAWTRNPTVERPYVSQRIDWRDVGTTAWTSIALSGAATSHTWTIGANRLIEAVVIAINAAGESDAPAILGPVATTPAPLPSLTAAWAGPTSILVTIPEASSIGDGVALEFSTDNSTWYPAATLTRDARSWLHEGVTTSVPHYYRARVTRSTPAGTPSSAWALSAVVPALTKPAPPTIAPLTVIDATATIPVTITHNPLDGSAQTLGQIQHRTGAGAWTTITLGTATTGNITSGYTNGQTIEIQARTAGAAGVYSDWSPSTLVTLRARPTLTITAPGAGATITTDTVTLTWTAAAQESAVAELLLAGQVIDTQQHDASTRAATFTGLADNTGYTGRVTIRDQWQASTPVTRAFTVDIASPAAPTLTATWDTDTATVQITVTPGAGSPATTRVELWRDGASIGDTNPSWTAVDPLPPLRRPTYRARAYTAAGGWTDSTPVQVIIDSEDVHINWGESHSRLLRGAYDPTIQVEGGRAKALRTYVGDDAPSITWGRRLPKVIRSVFTVDELLGDEPITAWDEASEYPGTVIWRDPSGRVLEGYLDATVLNEGDITQQSVSFTFAEALP